MPVARGLTPGRADLRKPILLILCWPGFFPVLGVL